MKSLNVLIQIVAMLNLVCACWGVSEENYAVALFHFGAFIYMIH